MNNLTRIGILCAFLLSFTPSFIYSQVTPAGADTDAECGPDCWSWFNWTPLDANNAEGVASDANCSVSIDGTAEYEGSDPNGVDLSGNTLAANMQGTSKDTWTFTFSTPLTDPVIMLGSTGSLLENASLVNI